MTQAHGQKAAAVPQSLTDVLASINTATDAVATKMTALRGQIKVSMTPTEVQGVQDQISALVTRLNGIAADPTDPVPTV